MSIPLSEVELGFKTDGKTVVKANHTTHPTYPGVQVYLRLGLVITLNKIIYFSLVISIKNIFINYNHTFLVTVTNCLFQTFIQYLFIIWRVCC